MTRALMVATLLFAQGALAGEADVDERGATALASAG